MRTIATIVFACIIGLSMTLAPTIMEGNVYADDTQQTAQQEEGQDAAEAVNDGEDPDAAAEEDTDTQENAVSDEDADTQETAVSEEDTETQDTETEEENAEENVEEDADLSACAAEDGSALEGLDGKNISDIENNSEISWILDDPTFYRYYDVDDDGLISLKPIPLDEGEAFIAAADANAEGIDDTGNIETDGDVTAMGGGVTGLGKGQTPAKYKDRKRYHCIDISWWQGKISEANWKKVRAAGVTHAIIRCGYSTLRGGKHNMDSTFGYNFNGAYKAGIKLGVYYYSTAVTPAEAKSEAQYVISILKNYKSRITLPVAFDYETGGRLTSKVMKSVGTNSCIAFCDTIRAAGYTPLLYANYTTLCNYINYKTLQSKYRIWLANYTTNGKATTYPGGYWMWQYSSSGRINGLRGRIDINYIFEKPAEKAAAVKTTKASAAKTTKAAATKATKAPATKTVKKTPQGHKAVTTTKMKYRKGPSKKKKKVGTYKKGTTIYIKSFHGNWAKMTNGYYINRSHLKYTAKTTDGVNYRTGPGKKYKKVGTYKKGKTITIVKVKDGWAKMSNGRWLSVKYTKIQ